MDYANSLVVRLVPYAGFLNGGPTLLLERKLLLQLYAFCVTIENVELCSSLKMFNRIWERTYLLLIGRTTLSLERVTGGLRFTNAVYRRAITSKSS